MNRIIVIGLDGATWDILKPLIKNQELPNFSKLITEGTYGTLISSIPPVTGPAWTSFSTGRNPGKHGIFDFTILQNNQLHLNKSNNIKSSTIYEIFSYNGIYSIIIGLPMSFPPPNSFQGIMISDLAYPNKAIFPISKEKYLENYEIITNFLKKGEELLDDMISTAKKRIETAKNLFSNEKWQFFFSWYGESDQVCHFFWKDLFKTNVMGQKIRLLFKMADEFIGWIMGKMQDNDLLFIISDHGFSRFENSVNLNMILKRIGLLKTKLDIKFNRIYYSKFVKHLINFRNRDIKEGKPSFKSKLYLKVLNISLIKRIFSICGYQRVNKKLILHQLPLYFEIIDYKKSFIYVPTNEAMGIYVNKKKKFLINDLISLLKRLKYNDETIFKKVFRKEEIYTGEFLNLAPDIVLIPNGFYISTQLSDNIITPFEFGAFHNMKGIFIGYGSEIKRGLELNILNICDIAPIILHAFNLKIPPDMDGNVIKQIYQEGTEKFKRQINFSDEYDIIKLKIKKLSKSKKI